MQISGEEIFRITQQVWDPMLGFPLIMRPERSRACTGGERVVISAISMTGDWKGGVVLEFEKDLSSAVAGHIFGMEVAEVESEDIHDAVGELANQVGGLIKGKLAPKSLLSLPTITEGIDLEIDMAHCQPIGAATMESQGAAVRIEVWCYIPET